MLRHTPVLRPDYSARFRCIGPACEDDCCHDWAVYIDKPTFEKYRSLPAGPLRTLIDERIVANSASAEESAAAGGGQLFASIRMLDDGRCPFHTEQKLCRIQDECGAEYLSQTCSTFPRSTSRIDGLQDETLSLSCPEAARMVLLDAKVFEPAREGGYTYSWDDAIQPPNLRSYFWPIRELCVNLVRNRAYSLWQRVFLLGTFTRRLDAIARGELDRAVPALLTDFHEAVNSGNLRTAMETIPADPATQLDMVLVMLNLPFQGLKGGVSMSARLRECLKEFVLGIHMQPTDTAENLKDSYSQAYERIYAPFFRAHPHILENYLINAILREQFPFGKSLFVDVEQPEFGKAFTQLATRFAVMKGLLIGVAGSHKEDFHEGHVVRTIQTACRCFEHRPEFVEQTLALLASRGMDNARGLTMLVRN